MENQYILSVDIGTSSCKTVLFNSNGRIIDIAAAEYPVYFGENGAVDQKPADWWAKAVSTIQAVLRRTEIHAAEIAVVGIDGHSTAMIPMAKDGEVLHNALIWTDKRAVRERLWIDQAVGQEVLTQINGNHNEESNVAPKIKWFQNHYPELYKKTYQIVNVSGYMVYQFTGKFTCNLSEGGLTQLFDVQKGIWSEELVRGCGIDIRKLPPIIPCYAIAGVVTEEASRQTGIPSGVPVVAGSMDTVACALGCGIIRRGDAFITGGTVTALGICSDTPVRNESFHVYPHIVPDTWCNVAGVDYGGGNFRWFRDSFMDGFSGKDVYGEMNRLAAEASVGAEKLLFLPTTVGQRCPQWDSNMKGMFFGVAPNHERKHFIRAVMEGNAYAVRELAELLEKAGIGADTLRIAGGISQSQIWMKIFADVLAKPLYTIRCEQATAMGNMLNAAYGVGILPSFDKVPDYIEADFVPFEQGNHDKYEGLYQIYTELYPGVREQFRKLAELSL